MKAKLSAVSALFVAAALSNGQVAAASACKGLSETACAANPDCGWTKPYTRKDGRHVSAYCRIKPQGGKTAQTDASKPKG